MYSRTRSVRASTKTVHYPLVMIEFGREMPAKRVPEVLSCDREGVTKNVYYTREYNVSFELVSQYTPMANRNTRLRSPRDNRSAFFKDQQTLAVKLKKYTAKEEAK